MADQLQLRRGTTSQILLATGAQGEVFYNTDTHALVPQDGITAGGFPQATGAQVRDGTFYYNENVGSAANAYILDSKVNTNTPSSYVDGVQFGFVTTKPNTGGAATANFQGLGVKSLKFPGGVDPQAGDISGRVYVIYDAVSGWLEIQRKATAAPPQLRTVSASVSSNAMTVGLAPDIIDFRSPSLGSGTINRRTIATALSLIIPAGATLGTQNGVQSRIAILALDNAGTTILGVANMAGSTNFDETTLVSTTAITSGASSANIVYASAAVAGMPFRVLGYVESTQAVAGTWNTVPSEVQGQGGQAIIGVAKIALSAIQPTTSGVSLDFTSIPSGTKRITFLFSGLSTNAAGSAQIILQLGSGSVQVTGYGAALIQIIGLTAGASRYTDGFRFGGGTNASVVGGSCIFNLMGANTWVAQGFAGYTNSDSAQSFGGAVTLTGILDRVRLTTNNGTDVFDAGVVNILFEG